MNSTRRRAVILVALVTLSGAVWREARTNAAASPRDETPAGLFSRVWTAGEGLGPLANAQSCTACHAFPVPGGSGVERESFVLLSPDEADEAGGHLFRQLLIRPGRAVVRRALPRTVVRRRPPALFGLAVLERIPLSQIESRADPDDADRDGISGRLAEGRFGWKARFATIRESIAAALIGELGLSNPVFAQPAAGGHPEISERQLSALTTFVAGLPPFMPRQVEAAGRATFERVGCGACHSSGQRSSTPEPYTDLLLHDMGALGDGIGEGRAGAREFRTPPLWGISRTGPPYLHDGRAAGLDAAIRAHDGEAGHSRTRYVALRPMERRALLAFLNGL